MALFRTLWTIVNLFEVPSSARSWPTTACSTCLALLRREIIYSSVVFAAVFICMQNYDTQSTRLATDPRRWLVSRVPLIAFVEYRSTVLAHCTPYFMTNFFRGNIEARFRARALTKHVAGHHHAY